jgi:hypothetical protein
MEKNEFTEEQAMEIVCFRFIQHLKDREERKRVELLLYKEIFELTQGKPVKLMGVDPSIRP